MDTATRTIHKTAVPADGYVMTMSVKSLSAVYCKHDLITIVEDVNYAYLYWFQKEIKAFEFVI